MPEEQALTLENSVSVVVCYKDNKGRIHESMEEAFRSNKRAEFYEWYRLKKSLKSPVKNSYATTTTVPVATLYDWLDKHIEQLITLSIFDHHEEIKAFKADKKENLRDAIRYRFLKFSSGLMLKEENTEFTHDERRTTYYLRCHSTEWSPSQNLDELVDNAMKSCNPSFYEELRKADKPAARLAVDSGDKDDDDAA